MPSDDLLPYPLAGADPGSDRDAPPPAAPDPDPPGLPWLPVALVGLILIAGLAIALLSLWDTHRADRALIEDLSARLAAAEEAVAQPAGGASGELLSDEVDEAVFGAEMLAASEAVDRFRAQASGAEAEASAELLVRAFFGRTVNTVGWNRLTDQSWPRVVLARIDDPQAPSTIWVSRRSNTTADPSVPAKTHCLALDVESVVASVASNRERVWSVPSDEPWPASSSSAPLRWWPDVYGFVPADRCGG